MLLLWVLRAFFAIVIIFAFILNATSIEISSDNRSFWAVFWVSFALAAIAFCVDVFTPKKKLAALAGVFFGLIVGILISAVLVPTVDLLAKSYQVRLIPEAVIAIRWTMSICICYLTISVVMRTKDDVRFVVPYVEFAKQTKGAKPIVLDTSAIIDGRITDLYQSRLFDAPLIVPRFVLNELQLISDSADKLKRNRGRRGLDILNKIQKDPTIDIEIDDQHIPDVEQLHGVDQKLVMFTKLCDGKLLTTDFNLTKVAQVRDVNVLNLNDLANSLKAIALPGEFLEIKVIKPGEELDQGIGYLPDGTMVVVEDGRNKIGKEYSGKLG